MANMTFKANLLPNSNLGYNLGSSDLKWTVYGAFKGNADTATALTSSAGSSTVPIYFSSGKPVQCSTTLGVSITGNAATATQLATTRTIWGQSFNGTANITGDMHYVGPSIYLPAGQTTMWLYGNNTGATAGFLGTGAIGASAAFSALDLSTYKLDINGKSRFRNRLLISGEWLQINNSGVDLQIGPMNSSWAHFQASTSFYFQPGICVDGNCWPYTDNTKDLGTSSRYWRYAYINRVIGITDESTYVRSPYSYPNNVMTQSIKASTILGNSSADNKLTHGFMENGPFGGYCDVICYSGYGQWGGTQIAAEYNANRPRLACRKFVQGSGSDGGAWGTWAIYWRQGDSITGAVWNDYAEMRNVPEANETDGIIEGDRAVLQAGRCVREVGDGTMILTTERMQKGCKIISDTFGFLIGETDNCKTPIAVCGRVLAYLYEGREVAKQHIGDPVCSGPNGTISLMIDEEYATKGYYCVGIISEVPDYEIYGTGNVPVDGRIWIYVK